MNDINKKILEDPLDDFYSRLSAESFNEAVVDKFKNQTVIRTVRSLTLLNKQTLLEVVGLNVLSDRLLVCYLIEEFLRKNFILSQKLFNDPVHGNVELHPLAVLVVNTPQFQRLRHVKQVAGLNYVYPGGTHTRFEHSIGTYHVAGQLVSLLRAKQPELHISPMDVICVQLAGLCHDLGHGPFSHMFDREVIPGIMRRLPEGEEKRKLSKWEHEDASIEMFEYLLDENDIRQEFNHWGFTDKDFDFVKELIRGPLEDKGSDWPYQGRLKKKAFLYEIISNKRNGVDVDKWDYIARDCYHLGIKNNFDHNRFMHQMRVVKVNGELQICLRDKEVETLYDMFYTRYNLHRQAYQHPVGKAVELMIAEALQLADNDLDKFQGEHGKCMKMSECVFDMKGFTTLTDYVYNMILLSNPTEEQNLYKAKELLMRIERRQLWKCAGITRPPKSHQCQLENDQVAQQIAELVACNSSITLDDLKVKCTRMDYGMAEENPVEHMRFYKKSSPNTAVQVDDEQVSRILPTKFLDKVIMVFCKIPDADSVETVRAAFTAWCKKNGYSEPTRGEISPVTTRHLKQKPAVAKRRKLDMQ